uniref:Uncharacterized protein n=1 Tax=Leersia perrieri TaxID=77586 RepID=A0A0D9VI43_9ORYZ
MNQLQRSNSEERRHARSLDAAAAAAAARKQPWYRRALGGLIPWARRPSATVAAPARAAERRPRLWSCAPLCSYDGLIGIHVDAVAPTRIVVAGGPAASGGGAISSSAPPRRLAAASPTPSWPGAVAPVVEGAWAVPVPCPATPVRRRRCGSPARVAPSAAVEAPAAAAAVELELEGPRRRVSFSEREALWNDALMRRFLRAQEEAPLPRCPHCWRWRAPGKSRLRRMSLPHVADQGEASGGTNGHS